MSWITLQTVKTGRKRILTYSGSWSGSAGAQVVVSYSTQGSAHQAYQINPNTGATIWDVQAGSRIGADTSLGADWVSGFGGAYGVFGGFNLDWIYSFTFPSGPRFQVNHPEPTTLPLNYSYTPSGGWQVLIPVEEYYAVQWEQDDDTGEFPLWAHDGGPQVTEPPYNTKIVFFEVIPQGATVTISASYGGVSGTVTGVAALDIELPTYEVHGFTGAFAQAVWVQPHAFIPPPSPSTGAASFSIDQEVSPVALTLDYNSDRDGGGVTQAKVQVNVSNETINSTAYSGGQGANPPLGGVWSSTILSWALPRKYNLDGRIYADKDLYATETKVTVRGDSSSEVFTVANGQFGGSRQQDYAHYSTRAEFKASLVSKMPALAYDIDTRQAITSYMTPSGLSANRENPKDWRTGWRGIPFRSFSLSQKSSLTVDDGSSLTPSGSAVMPGSWSASRPATMTTDGNLLTITVADGKATGTASRSFNDVEPGVIYGACFGGYRYLKISIRGSAEGLPFRLTLSNQDGTKYWDCFTGAKDTFADVILDLCNPHNKTASSDAVDSQWPLEGDYSSFRIVDGDYTGVTHVSSLTLSNLTNTCVYDVDSLTLTRNSKPLICIAPAFDNLIAEVTDDPLANYNRVRTVWADTDGRQSLEATEFQQDILGQPIIYSLSGLATGCNVGRNGWTASAFSSGFPDAYHTNALDGVCAWGAGLLFAPVTSSVPGWFVGFDRS